MEKRCFNQQEAREYLGVKRKFFDTHIAPRLQGVKAGTSLIYEKADIDKAWEAYKLESGSGGPEVKQWDAQQVSSRPRMVATKWSHKQKRNVKCHVTCKDRGLGLACGRECLKL